MIRSFSLFVKRALDVSVAFTILLLLSPLLLVTALLIVLEDGPPVFYTQKRAGLRGNVFYIFKFRSMKVNVAPVATMGTVTGDHPLVTRTGRFIRRFKIDELPQLLNVLRGELSLVGPRPTLVEQAERYDDVQFRRLLMRPGITGWAQVNGNIYLPWDERIALDVRYVDTWSLSFDLYILARTVGVVLFGEKPNRKAVEEALRHEYRTYRRS